MAAYAAQQVSSSAVWMESRPPSWLPSPGPAQWQAGPGPGEAPPAYSQNEAGSERRRESGADEATSLIKAHLAFLRHGEDSIM
jgi:hypothetical protein